MLGSCLRIVQDEVAMGEGAPLGVLAREPDRDPLDEQAGERERLRMAPVDAARVERLGSPLEHLDELRVDGEALGHVDELRRELSQTFGRDARLDGRFGGDRSALTVSRGLLLWSGE